MNSNRVLSRALPDLSRREESIYRKVILRILPLMFLCYIVSFMDRVNIGFAKLQMQSDLGFSGAVYGLGAGIFFVGYFLFEVPSNLLLHKVVGARKWIARIMISWGIISAAMAMVKSVEAFYVLRFMLGIAEAGFFPGILLYFTYWFPAERHGRVMSVFAAAVPIAGVIGGPLSGWILHSIGEHRGPERVAVVVYSGRAAFSPIGACRAGLAGRPCCRREVA